MRMKLPMMLKTSAVFLALAMVTTSCGASNSEPSLQELIDRVCNVMEPIGYDFTDETIQALSESVQQQLLDDIAAIEKIAPSRLEVPLATLCS
jgi:hypothetical protein